MIRIGQAIIITALLISCGRVSENQRSIGKKYYDIDFLIYDQIRILSTLKPELEKKVMMGEEQEIIKLTPDSSGWAGELELFRQADLNKPVLRDRYSVEETVEEGQYKITSYSLNQKGTDGVQSLKIFYDPAGVDLLKVESHLIMSNVLFNSDRHMEMIFGRDENGETFLEAYKIAGVQKIVLKEPVNYDITATLNYN